MILGIPTLSTTLPFTRGRMTSAAAVIVLTGALLLTQAIQAFNNETKYETVVELISSLSQSSVPKEILDSIPCDTVNPTIVSYIDCKELKDGAYQDPKTTNCSEYFRCENHQRVNCSCGPELIFDAKLQACNIGNQKAPCPHRSDLGVCFNKQNGFYHVPQTSCRKYYKCQDGKKTELECNPGEAFDTERETCIDEGQTSCEDDAMQADTPAQECSGKPDGRYGVADPQRKKFLVCSGGLKMSGGSCLEGQIFSEALQKCSSPSTVQEHETGCKGMPDGYHPDLARNCTHFFKCKAGQVLSTMTCPKGMRFDRELSYCTIASAVSCIGSHQTTVAIRPRPSDCRGKSNGYYPLPSTKCSQFVFCKNGHQLMSLHCPVGQAYDASFRRCMNENFVHCEGHLPTEKVLEDPKDSDCFNRSDDYYPDYATHCKKFYACKDERKMSELVCRPGDAFDPVTKNCHPQATVDCHDRGKPQTFCSGKSDGYYANPAHACKTFYSCRGEHIAAELACGLGEIFKEDSQTCWPQSLVACFPSPFEDSPLHQPAAVTGTLCQNKTDGYYPDYASGCRKYFHCRTGQVATEYVCTAGQLFDPMTSKCLTEPCVSCSETGLRTDIDSCDFKNDGYYPMYCNGCRSYYYCRNRLNMVNITCAAGQIFDTNTKVCSDEKFAVCNVEASPNSSLECRGRSDGFYAASSTGNCSIYFFCSHGMSSEKYSCSNGTCFDENSGVCLAKSGRKFNCTSVPDGYYVDSTSSCRQYFVCQEGKLEVMKCPGNMIFHLNDISCKSKRTSQCKILRHFNCSAKPDGVYEDHQGNKQLFHLCKSDKHVESGSCPLDSNFGRQRNACVPATARQPTSSFRPSWTMGSRPSSSNQHSFDCRKRDNGLYSDASSGCSKFYVCMDGQLMKSSPCPPGQLFHARKQECRPSEEVTCEDKPAPSRNGTSGPKASSFHFQFRDGCRNVTLCFDSKESFWLHCPMPSRPTKSQQYKHYCKIGNIADSKGNASPESPRSTSSTFDCSGKEDGYYTDPESSCRKWHMCEASRGYTYECEAGKAFNLLHKRCDLSEAISCAAQSWVYRNYSSARSLPSSFRSQMQEFRRQSSSASSNQECGRKSDGIYIDLTGVSSVPSNTCFNVYLCINEQLYSISCPFETQGNAGEHEVMCKAKDDVKCMKDGGSAEKAVTSLPETREHVLNDGIAIEAIPKKENFTCVDRDDGFHVDFKTNCEAFYVCHGGITNAYACPASLIFNSDTKACDLPENVVCLLQAVNVLTCPGNLTKVYPDHDSGCQNYFGCFNGSFRYLSCPTGDIFDAKTLACVAPNKVACTNTITVLEQDVVEAQSSSLVGRRLPLVTSSDTSVTPALVTSSFNCSHKADGFYPDHEQDCHVFYRCVHGKKFSHYCTTGQLFSSQLQGCDFEENVKCDEQKFFSIKPDQ